MALHGWHLRDSSGAMWEMGLRDHNGTGGQLESSHPDDRWRPEAVTEVIQEHVGGGSLKGLVTDGFGVDERTGVKDNPQVLIYATQWWHTICQSREHRTLCVSVCDHQFGHGDKDPREHGCSEWRSGLQIHIWKLDWNCGSAWNGLKKVKKGRGLGLDPQTNTYQLYKGDNDDIPKRKIAVWEQRWQGNTVAGTNLNLKSCCEVK